MTMQVTSAYRFVPLSRRVVRPVWQDRVSHDFPLAEGLCAEFEVEIEAHTPLIVGGPRKGSSREQPGEVEPYRLPDGRPAIPGSSVRGLLRNVLEIATFARLAPVMDDRALSLRDLHLPDYRHQLTRTVSGAYQAVALGGWLRFDAAASVWSIHEHRVLRICHKDLIYRPNGKNTPTLHERMATAYQGAAGDEQRSARLKYRETGGKVAFFYRSDGPRAHTHSDGKRLHYERARLALQADSTGSGYLVLTGQPGLLERPDADHTAGTKHLEFLFDAKEIRVRPVPNTVMRQFREIHAESADLAFLESSESPHAKRGVPVFFLTGADGSVASLGLSQMYRLAGAHTLGRLAALQQEPVSDAESGPLDFTQTLFGHVLQERPALKGRVMVGDFIPAPGTAVSKADARYSQPTVLGSPKPGFYPNYIHQKPLSGRGSPVSAYSTVLSKVAPQLSGWKRYPVRPACEVALSSPPAKSSAAVQVRLRPLAAGCRFRGTIRLHNVCPEEAGALLWALDFGEPPAEEQALPRLRHGLGLGKPFGFGQVSLRLCAPPRIRANDPRAPAPAPQALRQAFEAYMGSKIPNWVHSDQLLELRAAADPQHPGATRANLTPPQDPKEFAKIKKERLALRPYSSHGPNR